MRKVFMRMTALALFLAIGFSLIAGVPWGNTTSVNAVTKGDTGKNLMEGMNPSFEEVSIPNWTTSEGVTQSKDYCYGEGKWSLRFADESDQKSCWAISDKAALEADVTYIASAQVLGDAIGQLTVLFYDASGNVMTAQTLSVTMTGPSDTWQLISKAFEVPAGATHAAARVSTTDAGTGVVYFDAVGISKQAAVIPEPELVNGSFDAPLVGGKVPGWKNRFSEKVSLVPNGEGTALQITETKGYSMISDRFPIQGGAYYTFSVDIKLVTSKSTCQLYLYFYEDETTTTKLKTYSFYPGGDFSAEWTKNAVQGLAPVNAKYAEVLITDPTHTGTVSLFDNAKITIDSQLPAPSFEAACNARFSAGWTVNGTKSVLNTDPKYVRSGKQSVGMINQSGEQLYSYYMKVNPGENYEASIYVKREEGQTDDINAALFMMFYDKNGVQRTGNHAVVAPVSDQWLKLTVTGTANANDTSARMLFYVTKGSGYVYLDDADFKQVTDWNLGVNQLENNSFETRTVENNSIFPKWSMNSKNYPNSMSIEYVGGGRGNAARMTTMAWTIFWSQAIPVTPGETYSLTLDVSGVGRMQSRIYYYASETDDWESYLLNSSGGAIVKTQASFDLREGVWDQMSSTSVAPEGAKYARIWLMPLSDTISKKSDVLVDNVQFIKGVPDLTIPGEVGQLPNGSYETLNAIGEPVSWHTWGDHVVHSIIDASKEPDNVFDGKYAMKIEVSPDLSGTMGIVSDRIPVQEGITYLLGAYAREADMSVKPFQVHLKFYDNSHTALASVYCSTAGTGEWNYVSIDCAAPPNSVYAQVILASGAAKGAVYFDKLELTAGDADANPVVPYDGEWELIDQEHPRVYFNQSQLKSMQIFAGSKGINAFGYSGKATLESLLKKADGFLAQTDFMISHKGVEITYPLYPVFEDPSCRKEFETPPPGMTGQYPYMTAVAMRTSERLEALALAYALTGDKAYGERAVKHVLDMTEWEYWAGHYITHLFNGEQSDQSTGDFLRGVSKVYDMCYDLMTESERQKVSKAIMEKGLDPMMSDCVPRMNRGRDMDHADNFIIASCAIMTEENIDQVKKYLDMGVTYMNWRLNHFHYSGINEGYSYDSLAFDDLVVAMDAMERVTGYSGPIEHPYMEVVKDRCLGFFNPADGTLPAYSDADFGVYYPYSMAIFSRRGDSLATYYLSISGALQTDFDKLVYFTNKTSENLEFPDDREGNVTYLDKLGFGALRTGWGVLDPLMVINCNNSQKEHNHYDQNSIMLAFNGSWIITDSGYKDMSYGDRTTYQMKYTNSTIFVDSKPQVLKGQGTLKQVFGGQLYGYLIGSAPKAYGMEDKQQVLDKFDRHTIMVNHDSQPYYIVIDDLESSKERTFGWNFFTGGWDRLELDGKNVIKGESGTGNRVTISRFGCALFSHFVGNDPVTSKELMYADLGPTLLMESKPAKKHQFMNVLSIQKGSGSQASTLFENYMKGPGETVREYADENGLSWSSQATDFTKNSITSVNISGRLVMFRAGEPGDWITFPFVVEKAGEYGVTIEMGRAPEYRGSWNLYIDGKKVATYDPTGPLAVMTVNVGKMTFTEGKHIVKMELGSTPYNKYTGTIASCGSITLDNGQSIGSGAVNVTETYDDENMLGAAISYGTVLSDLVLFNRGTKTISAGKLSSNGKQISVLGLYNDEITEGYSVTDGTSMKYGDLELMSADGPVSVAVDFTFARLPVKNTDDEKELELHEDFDIDVPVINVSTSAEQARKVTLYVGKDAPYTATINGETVESSYSDNMLTLTVPEGVHEIKIVGKHQCVFDQYATHIMNVKEWAGCGHGNIYYVSCVCQRNGTETFEDGAVKGHKLVAVEAKAATETEDGNIAYWKCKTCGICFADAKGKQELKAEDVILPKLIPDLSENTFPVVPVIIGAAAVLLVAGFVIFALKKGIFKKKEV